MWRNCQPRTLRGSCRKLRHLKRRFRTRGNLGFCRSRPAARSINKVSFSMHKLLLALFSVLSCAVSALCAAEPTPRPRHDPPEQLFRRAPMAESARSVVVNLATNLHYAFDTDFARVHTVWE